MCNDVNTRTPRSLQRSIQLRDDAENIFFSFLYKLGDVVKKKRLISNLKDVAPFILMCQKKKKCAKVLAH